MNDKTSITGQPLERTPSPKEVEFMRSVAFPELDQARDEKTLEGIAETLWNLCQWEKQRADILDTKTSYLLGLSSIAAAVVAVGGTVSGGGSSASTIARCVSLALFVVTVTISLITLTVTKYGGFLDTDVFKALSACRVPVGNLPAFADPDPYRCFLREISLQRWLIYRWYSEENDVKYRWLGWAQLAAVVAVASLLGIVFTVLSSG